MDRWVRMDAESINVKNLPDTGIPITEWTALLDRAETSAEFYVITDAVLGEGPDAVLSTLDEFLNAAADWCDAHQQRDTAHEYREAGQHLGRVSRRFAEILNRYLDVAYEEACRATQAAHQPATAKNPAPSAVPAPPTPPGGKGPTR